MTLLAPPRPRTAAAPPPRERRRLATSAAVLLASLGLAVQAVGYLLGWNGRTDAAIVAYYLGLPTIIVPVALIVVDPRVGDAARRWTLPAYGLLFQLSWWITSPVLATRFDETLHVATLTALTDGDGWFHPNPMLPVSPHYPGLELATTAVWWLTGLPLPVCQAVVLIACRIVLMLALMGVAERVTGSTRTAGVVVMLYSASPQFVFFNAQYAYQTLALPLLVGVLLLLLTADDERALRRRRLLVAAAGVLALAVTHHLTSWVGAIALVGLALAAGRGRRGRTARTLALVAVAAVGCWTAIVGPLLADYLGPIFSAAGDQAAQLLALDGAQRTVGADSAGTPTPPWELVVMALSVLAWLVLLVAAGLAAMRGRLPGLGRHRGRWLLIVAAACYPALIAARFAPTASEVADRSSTFVLLALALLAGAWLAPRLHARAGGVRAAAGALLLTVLVVGGAILGGGPDWQRIPGPYLPGAEQRSVDATSMAAARWAGAHLPDGARVAGDLTLLRVLPDVADVVPVTTAAGDDEPTQLFVSPDLTADDLDLLRRDDVQFVVVDLRIAGHEALSGNLFDAGSAFGPSAVRPAESQLTKFAGVPGAVTLLDGPVRVYDLRAYVGGGSTLREAGDPLLPGDWRPSGVATLGLVAALLLAGALVRRAVLVARGDAVGPRLRAPDLAPGSLTPLLAVLPASVALGAVAVPLAGSRAWSGSVALVVLAMAGAVVLLRPRRTPSPHPTPHRDADDAAASRTAPWLLAAAGVVVLACIATTTIASWEALMSAPLPPAPPASTAPSASTTTSTTGGTP